jgi:hypothetical protein
MHTKQSNVRAQANVTDAPAVGRRLDRHATHRRSPTIDERLNGNVDRQAQTIEQHKARACVQHELIANNR